MDSKLKKNAILFCIMAILCIASVVVIANWQTLFGKTSQTVNVEGSTDGQTDMKQGGQIGDMTGIPYITVTNCL